MTIAIIHDDDRVYIKMSPDKFIKLLTLHLKDKSPEDAVNEIVKELKREALTK